MTPDHFVPAMPVKSSDLLGSGDGTRLAAST
jgi:hypothetical protein